MFLKVAYKYKADKDACFRRWREQKIRTGLCTRCGTNKSQPKRRKCSACLRKTTDEVLQRVAQRKSDRQCLRCNVPVSNGVHCDRCVEVTKDYNARTRERNRNLVFDQYGRKCACCGEQIRMFLTVEHLNGGGRQHRLSVKTTDIYRWLVREFNKTGKWPEGFGILCYNCNAGQWRNAGICPHREGKTNG